MDVRISSGVDFLDEFLAGGFEKDIVTMLYGPAGSGKSLICLITALNTAKQGKKVIFIDTEGGFSLSRLSQLNKNYKSLLDNIIISKPTTFEDQRKIIEQLKEKLENESVDLIIIDTISMLYRVGVKEEGFGSHRDLALQFLALNEIARKKRIPVIATNQVYADFDVENGVKMVGGDLLKYASKCLIELKKYKNHRAIFLKKHRSLPDEKNMMFKIVQDGMIKVS